MLSSLFKGFLIITLLGLTIYSFSFPNSFIWDDEHLIQENRFIKNLDNWKLAFTHLLFNDTQGRGKFYRPIQEISYALDYRIWGLNPSGFHLTNSLLHIASSLLFSLILYQIFKNPFISFWGGAFFVLHPIHTEAIAYVAGRAEPLALFFLLLSLSSYIRGIYRNKLILTFSLFSFLLALFSKESSLIFPLVILTYNFVFLKEEKLRKKLYPFFIFIIVMGLYLSIRFKFVPIKSLTFYEWNLPWQIRLLTELKIIIKYLLLLIFPHNLHMERFVPWSKSLLDFAVISSIIFISLVIYICVKLSRKEKALIFFSLFFIITLFPFLNIIPLNAQLAEHWLYLPSIGFFAIFAWGAFKIKSWLEHLSGTWERINLKLGKNFLPLILTLVLAIYSFITIRQIYTWKDPLTFYKYTATKAPYSQRIELALASAYSKEKKYLEAASLLKTIVKISPEDFKARNNLALALIKLGKLNEAQRELNLILKTNPEYAQAYLNLANLYLTKEEKEKAKEVYYETIKILPQYIYSYYELGNLYYKNDEVKEAVEIYKKGIVIDDKFPELHNNLGICYAKLGKLEEAEKEWIKAVELDFYYLEPKYNLEKLKRERSETIANGLSNFTYIRMNTD